MMNILQTRLIHWKKQGLHLLFWLLSPMIVTWLVITAGNAIQDDTKIPVGVVLKEDTELAHDLYESIHTTPFIRAYALDEREALHKLEKHELDSVFIIVEGYEEDIRHGNRNELIKAYESDVSLAYTPVSEMVMSYVQQDVGRSKAAYAVKELADTLQYRFEFNWDDLIARSKQIEKEQDLLQTTLTFLGNGFVHIDEGKNLFQPWHIWALAAFLSTLLLFDWVIKENNPAILPRFAFTRMSMKTYFVQNMLIYITLLFAVDLLTVLVFYYVFYEPISFSFIISLLSYRLMISLGAFLLALIIRQTYVFYATAFILTFVSVIASGAIIPLDGLLAKYPWIHYFNPLNAFLQGDFFHIGLGILFVILLLWYGRKEEYDATS
ncbi:MAG TPA: ABC transporter permease [Cerasibacillus sp.]|uniref:ABC transporter permease n=1 Tax=Cerasibacillus sp. TaxID=2498711 RepID=UPI002F3EF25E